MSQRRHGFINKYIIIASSKKQAIKEVVIPFVLSAALFLGFGIFAIRATVKKSNNELKAALLALVLSLCSMVYAGYVLATRFHH